MITNHRNQLWPICFAIATALALASTDASAAIPASEQAALVALYNSTNGPSWTDHTNWLGGEGTDCSWYGVMCDSGHTTVKTIHLGANQLLEHAAGWALMGQMPGSRTRISFGECGRRLAVGRCQPSPPSPRQARVGRPRCVAAKQ